MAEKRENRLFRLEEMADEMEKTIFDIKKTIEMQNRIVKIVEDGTTEEEKKAGTFEIFTNQLNENNKKYNEQLPVIAERVKLLREVIEVTKASKECEDVIYKFCKAVGLLTESK